MALLEAFCAFFWPPFPETLFSLTLVCCLLPRHLSKWTPAKRCKTRGFGAISRLCASSIPCGISKKTSFCGPVLRIIFCVCYYFVRFDVRVFVEFGFQRSKNPWGCRTELVLKRVFFAVCPLSNLARGGCAAVSFFSVDFGSLPKMSSRLRCGGFFRLLLFFLFDPVFENFKWSSSHPPVFLWVFFSFGCILLGIGGNAALQLCFWAVGLQPFLFFGVFLEKHCFSPWKRVIWVHFSVSPFCVSLSFFLVFFTSLCHSLSLSLSIFLSSLLFFSSLLSCFYFYLPCFIVVISCLVASILFMRRTTSTYYIWKFYFHNLCLFIFCFVFQICSYVCFFSLFKLCVLVNINVFKFSKKTISKTPIFVLHIVKGYRFL